VRWISVEPLLGPVYVSHSTLLEDIDWVVVGGESGPRARPCDLAWIRSIKEQCQAAGVPVFVKQMGSKWAARMQAGNAVRGFNDPDRAVAHRYDKKGGNMAEWPEDLRVREYPQ
jgi:protein gp37